MPEPIPQGNLFRADQIKPYEKDPDDEKFELESKKAVVRLGKNFRAMGVFPSEGKADAFLAATQQAIKDHPAGTLKERVNGVLKDETARVALLLYTGANYKSEVDAMAPVLRVPSLPTILAKPFARLTAQEKQKILNFVRDVAKGEHGHERVHKLQVAKKEDARVFDGPDPRDDLENPATIESEIEAEHHSFEHPAGHDGHDAAHATGAHGGSHAHAHDSSHDHAHGEKVDHTVRNVALGAAVLAVPLAAGFAFAPEAMLAVMGQGALAAGPYVLTLGAAYTAWVYREEILKVTKVPLDKGIDAIAGMKFNGPKVQLHWHGGDFLSSLTRFPPFDVHVGFGGGGHGGHGDHGHGHHGHGGGFIEWGKYNEPAKGGGKKDAGHGDHGHGKKDDHGHH